MASSAASAPSGAHIVFTCQKCKRALGVAAGGGLQESTLLDLATREPLPPHLGAGRAAEAFKRAEKASIDLLSESFLVVDGRGQKVPGKGPAAGGGGGAGARKPGAAGGAGAEAKGAAAPGRSQSIEAMTRAFEVAADRTQVDHPLCKTCTEMITRELERHMREVETDRDYYRKFLDSLSVKRGAAPSSAKPLTAAEEAALKKEEEELQRELDAVRQEREALRQERELLTSEAEELDGLEGKFWEAHQHFELEKERVADEQRSVAQKVAVASAHLERLKRTNVYDDAFHISYSGHFGTINGFRLGRLPSSPVDWTEINAALGQVVLLLQTIAQHCNYRFTRYQLIPAGSFSKMAKADDPSTFYELYGSNDINLSRLFWYRRFDTALTWLLICVREFGEHATELDKNFRLRYSIRDDMIEGLSVKLQFNQDHKWTKALKYMLLNVKMLLAFSSKHGGG